MEPSTESLPADENLAYLEQLVRTRESAGYRLLSLAAGRLNSRDANVAVFDRLPPFQIPPAPTLASLPDATSLARLQRELDAAVGDGREVVGVSRVWVSGNLRTLLITRG